MPWCNLADEVQQRLRLLDAKRTLELLQHLYRCDWDEMTSIGGALMANNLADAYRPA